MSERKIAALYVMTGGCYFGLDEVDPWDEQRDARLYAGPYPVVAHPPCQRWGYFATGGPKAQGKFKAGEDGGCFAAALAAVRSFGGVLEHPRYSKAFTTFSLAQPPKEGWVVADTLGGWVCQVDQGFYGHPSRKPTWLYGCHIKPPSLRWGRSSHKVNMFDLIEEFSIEEQRLFMTPPKGMTSDQRQRRNHWLSRRGELAGKTFCCQENIPLKAREATPLPFRDLLLSISRTAYDRK